MLHNCRNIFLTWGRLRNIVTQHCLVVWSGGSSYITVFYPLLEKKRGKIMKWKEEKVPVTSEGLAFRGLLEEQQHVRPQSSGGNNRKQKKMSCNWADRRPFDPCRFVIGPLSPLAPDFLFDDAESEVLSSIIAGTFFPTAVTTWRCVYLLYITSNVTARFFSAQ